VLRLQWLRYNSAIVPCTFTIHSTKQISSWMQWTKLIPGHNENQIRFQSSFIGTTNKFLFYATLELDDLIYNLAQFAINIVSSESICHGELNCTVLFVYLLVDRKMSNYQQTRQQKTTRWNLGLLFEKPWVSFDDWWNDCSQSHFIPSDSKCIRRTLF